jgi:SAM-dependent methyltransferase
MTKAAAVPTPAPATYSVFAPRDAWAQVRGALARKSTMQAEVDALLGRLRRDLGRIEGALGRPLEGLDILELGPGQQCVRSGVLGIKNRVTAVDLDEIPFGFDLGGFLRVARKNGAGRLLKTLARKGLGLDRAVRGTWAKAVGARALPLPRLLHGDVCAEDGAAALPLEPYSFDVIVSWSVFEHLPDPHRAVERLVRLLRPGGVLYLGVHLFTSNNGHHDLRAFNGRSHALPAWGHLRPETKALIHPSSVLNEWRLERWREWARVELPGAQELQERYGEERLKARLEAEGLREQLAAYSDEELFTVELFFLWRKPTAGKEPSASPESANGSGYSDFSSSGFGSGFRSTRGQAGGSGEASPRSARMTIVVP